LVDLLAVFSLLEGKKDFKMNYIESLIPHREPIKIITEIIELQDDFGMTAAVVNEGWPTSNGHAVKPYVFIEAIAQTAAIVEGHKRRKEGKDGVKGWLVGIKSAEFNTDEVPVGTRVVITVKSLSVMDDYAVVDGIVKSGEDIIARAVIQALRLNEDNV